MSKQDQEIFDNFMDNISYGYDELVSEYPKISEYLQKKQADNEANSPVNKLKQILKGKEMKEAEPQQAKVQEEVKTEPEKTPNEDKAQAALARLRQLLSKNKESEEKQEEITPEIQRVEENQPVVKEFDNVQQNEVEKVDVSDTLAKIAAKEISLVEKVRLINVFAGVCYQQGDYQSAFDLLSAALELDGQDAATLKNIAYTCLSAGEQEQALSFAAKLPVVDFALLYALKQRVTG